MSLYTNNFDEHLRERLSDAEMAPQDYMWDRIEAELPEKKRRIPLLPLFISAGVITVASLLTLVVKTNFLPQNISSSKDRLHHETVSQSIQSEQYASSRNTIGTNSNHSNTTSSDDNTINKINNNNSNNSNNVIASNSNTATNKDDNEKSSTLAYLKQKKNNKKSQQNNTATPRNSSKNYQDDEYINPGEIIPATTTVPETVTTTNKGIDNATTENLPTKQAVLQEIHKEMEQLLDKKIPEITTPTTEAAIEQVDLSTLKKLENLKLFTGYNIKRGIHIGPYVGITSNWITRQTIDPENLDKLSNRFEFGKMAGISLGYDFSDRWGVLSEIAYSSQHIGYIDNNDINYDLKMTYLKMPFMMKYKLMFLNDYNSKPIVMNFLFGGHYSQLMKCNMLVDNKIQTFDQLYNHREWGLMTGVDFDIYLNKNFYFTSGIRTGFGATTQGFPRLKGEDGNQPLSFQIGVYTKISFRKPFKIK